jgi:hypothetical protein
MRRWLVLVCALAACGGTQICAPGGELTCTGPNGCNGTRVCSADGTAFSVCECNGATGGMTGGVGGVGGSAGVGGAAGSGVGGTGGAGGMGLFCNPTLDGTGMINGCEGNPGGPKCAATFPTVAGASLQCELAGTLPAGAACSTLTDAKGRPMPGVDNCLDGFCTAFGVTTGEQCDRYCDYAHACAGTDVCFFIARTPDMRVYGTCRRPCNPFAGDAQCPRGNSLLPNQVCSWSIRADSPYMQGSCNVYNGTAQLGAFCNADVSPPLNCASGSICLGDHVCHALCDDLSPCAGGQTCTFATFATSDGCDVGTGMGCPNACPSPGVIDCEQCNRATGQCLLVLSTPMNGGWCVAAMPDAGP